MAGGTSGPVTDAPDADERTDDDTRTAPAGPGPTGSPGRLWAGRAVVLATVAVAAGVLLATGRGVATERIAAQWQLVDLAVLGDDPLGSVWHLHTQPPAYNLLVGLLAWSPLPLPGTLYALNLVALAGTGLLLHDLLVRWGRGPLVAGAIVAVALLDPSLLSALHWGHYEILVAFLLVAVLSCAVRFLERSGARWLLATAALATLCGLLRSLFHPVWVLAVVATLLALRPVPRRHAVLALGLPVAVLGGWMVKNAVVFGTPTTSSWLGFNLQRGVVAAMAADDVRDAVDHGRVSALALEYPWGRIDQYERWVGECAPHDHPATAAPTKDAGGLVLANFNHECFLPVYRQAQDDAVRLVRDHPDRYLTTRLHGLVMAYHTSPTSSASTPTVIDRLYRPLLLTVTITLPEDDWNLPFLMPIVGTEDVPVSLSLLGLSLFVVARGGVAAVRLARAGWGARSTWSPHEVTWVLAAATVLFVVVGGSAIEYGENGRFRSSLDPLLVTLPAGWVAGQVGARRRARVGAAGAQADGCSTTVPAARSTS